MGFEVFGVGVPEMVVILVVALIFLGPEKLPEAARTLGTWVREIRKFTGEASSILQETLQVGDTIKSAVYPTSPSPSGVKMPAAQLPPPAAAAVAYTPPAAEDAPPEAAPPGVLEYPAPFKAPAPSKPPAETLDYPAPFVKQ